MVAVTFFGQLRAFDHSPATRHTRIGSSEARLSTQHMRFCPSLAAQAKHVFGLLCASLCGPAVSRFDRVYCRIHMHHENTHAGSTSVLALHSFEPRRYWRPSHGRPRVHWPCFPVLPRECFIRVL
ncbi:hypothetical protein PISMIDRAFT_364165 [Pisolithus microcarpus 441]|uniref:Uncharacterized protein n=1 Tax=Pisolithus microcarpus 441 TaxID=765257 RepID=A0A0C9YBB5_9AGAM|nr:hypothetical protein PISMIDRAFT_364165 [Pisolithus microcarpus 441]